MSPPVKLLAFVAGLATVFGLAMASGSAVGPLSDPTQVAHGSGHTEEAVAEEPDELPGGLMVSQDGYTLRLVDGAARPGQQTPVELVIEGPDGAPVTAYEVDHEKRLHLIAARRDFSGFQHVHPRMTDDGTWSTTLDLTPGPWRLFADFTPEGGSGLTLGADLSVPGDYRPRPETGEVRTAKVDGYTVTLDGELRPGTDAELTLRVERDGRPVTDLDPYLGAYGHLVALREGDLAYLHVHPDGAPGDGETRPGPEVVFYAGVPSTGDYRLFLDFRHDGAVRTAAFRLGTAGGSGGSGRDAGEEHDVDGH